MSNGSRLAPATYTIADLSALGLGSRSTIHRQLRKGGAVLGVRALRVGARIVFPRAPIDRVLELNGSGDPEATT